MKRFRYLIAILGVALIVNHCPTVMANSAGLDSAEANSVVFFWDFSKFKRDFFITGNDFLNEPELISLSVEEQHHVDVLEYLMRTYEIDEPIYYWGNLSWDFWLAALDIGISQYLMWPNINYTDPRFFQDGAFIEEVYIRELRQALVHTDEASLVDSYTNMLTHAGSHLLYFASRLLDDPFEYVAQVLTQEEVDAILAEAVLSPVFEINPGLNDAWHYPETNGQGFFISVFPHLGTVSLGWFTFDTELPDETASANLGDPGQRWLIASGKYEGSQATLNVKSLSGGLFDTSPPEPVREEIGTIILQFEDCNSGSVTYDLPTISMSGVIPIERVATDSVAVCEAYMQSLH